jgi:Family of unknown function (DUF6069)
LLSRIAIAAVAAVVGNVLLRALAIAVFDIPDAFEHLALRAVIVSTLVGVLAAAVVYAVIERQASDPARTFTKVALVALVVSLAAPLSVSGDEGAEAAAIGTLMLMHVLTAAVVIAAFSRR